MAEVFEQLVAAAQGTGDRPTDKRPDRAVRFLLIKELVEAERVLHLGRGQPQNGGDLGHGLEWHVPQFGVDDV